MLHVIVSALPPGRSRGEVGVSVPAIETADPNLVVTPSLGGPGYIITHVPTGRALAGADGLPATLVLVNRILAVSVLYGIDWISKPPLDARRKRALRWAVDEIAAMFRAPMPDVVEEMMDARHSGIVLHEETVATLLGA